MNIALTLVFLLAMKLLYTFNSVRWSPSFMVNFCRCIFIFSLVFDEVRKMVSTLMILTSLSISSRQPRSDAASRQRESLQEKNKRSTSSAALAHESHLGSSGKQAIFRPSSVNAMVLSFASDGRTARRCVSSRRAAVIDFSSGLDRKSNVDMFDMPMARICRAAVDRLHRSSSGIGVEGSCSNSSSARRQE